MKTPSVKALVTTFKLTPAQAGLIKRLGNAADQGANQLQVIVDAECPATAAYTRQCYSSPYDSYGWRVTVALHAMDIILGTHGVEALDNPDDNMGGAYIEYLNTGDSYATTLIYHPGVDALRIGNWGDIAERFPCSD